MGLLLLAGSARGQNVFESPAGLIPETQIDRLVTSRWGRMNINPSVCSDAVFIRRVYLDMLATIPTAKEARDFIEDQGRNKRSILIDQVLEREEYADCWGMKWGDLLRIKAEFPVNLWPNAAQAYHRWVRAAMRDNMPYDQFVRQMLTSNGSNFRVGPVNFYRAIPDRTPEGIAVAVALTFMGSRAEFWPKSYMPGLKAFFTQISYKPTREWKEEVVFWDPFKPAAQPPGNAPRTATLPDGTQLTLPPDRDPREIFADWLITPQNPWFTLNIVNRMWSWLLGRGVIHEPDDIRSNNPASHPELLAYLQKELVASRYNMRHIFRLILNSRTYQFSSMPKFNTAQAESSFAFYPLRRLDAEVLIDAINKVTGTSDLYTSPIPEPFTYIPDDKPAVALPDGSITSAFLELFGRPARATGLENERITRPLPSQRLHMLNSSHIQRKIEKGPRLKAVLDSRRSREVVEELYLTILSRLPTPDEMRNAESYAKSSVVKGREGWVDLTWALFNSAEFLYRH